MKNDLSSVTEFHRRKMKFALRGILPMLLIIMLGCILMSWAIRMHSNLYIAVANGLFFVSGMVFVITAKRYYRCPVCEKVVVPTKDDGTPSEISFGIAYKPKECPYCKAALL